MKYFKIIGICICLLIGAIFDLHTKKIPKWYAILFLGIGISTVLFVETEKVVECFLGGGFGLLFFLLAKITKESIGYGDAFLITGLGFTIGCSNIFIVIMISLFLMFPFSVVLISMKKATKKSKLPFLPFLFVGMALQFLLGEIL